MTEPHELDPEVTKHAALPPDFEAFFEREQKAFLAYAGFRLRDRRDAEEAVLKAGYKMFTKWERILAHANPLALTQAILVGVVRDYWRAQSRRREHLVADPPDLEHLVELRSHEHLDLALDDLERTSPLQANCVRLRWLVELSYDQIGTRLDISAGAAKTNVHLGIARLKTIMNRPEQGEGGV